MIDKKSIIKMAEHVFRKSQGYPDRRLIHPRREWGLGVLLFVVIVILGSVTAGKIFVLYGDTQVVEGNSGGSIPKYRAVIVQDALEKHRARVKQFEILQGEEAPIVVSEASASSTQQDIPPENSEVDVINLEVE